MNTNAVLKVVNPALAILMLNQPLSAFLMVVPEWDLFEGLHVGGGLLLLLAASIHLMLNWRWVATNLLKKSKKQEAQ